MVVGKLSILLIGSPAFAGQVDNPRFFEYRSGNFVNHLVDISFGWFRTLNTPQKQAYDQALTHAVMYSDNGQRVRWYESDASGEVVPVMTWPNGHGFCRRMHIQAIAYGVEKTMSATACFENSDERWTWYKE
jgi:surface antigen